MNEGLKPARLILKRLPGALQQTTGCGARQGGLALAKKDAKIDPRLDAIRYQEMLRQVGAKKRATEPQAKEEVDKLAKADGSKAQKRGLLRRGTRGDE